MLIYYYKMEEYFKRLCGYSYNVKEIDFGGLQSHVESGIGIILIYHNFQGKIWNKVGILEL